MKTRIICGFPGVGKSYAANIMRELGLNVLDLKSDLFDKKYFPSNCLKDILNNLGKCHIIFTGTEPSLLSELDSQGIKYKVVVPKLSKDLIPEYIDRYKKIKYSDDLVNDYKDNFILKIRLCSDDKDDVHYLSNGEYLFDFIKNEIPTIRLMECFSKLDKSNKNFWR